MPTFTLIRSGNAGSCSIVGPSSSSDLSGRQAHEEDEVRVADVEGHRTSSVPGQRQLRRVHRVGQRDVVPAEFGSPKLISTSPFSSCPSSTPPAVSILLRPLAEPRNASRCRSSRLRRRRCSRSASEGRRITWLQHDKLVAADTGLAVGDRPASPGVTQKASFRASMMTKSLPRPCILWKCRPIGADLGSGHSASPPGGTNMPKAPMKSCNRLSSRR